MPIALGFIVGSQAREIMAPDSREAVMGGPAGVSYERAPEASGERGDGISMPQKIKRVWLASFLSAMASVVVVTVAGAIVLFALLGLRSLFGLPEFPGFGLEASQAPIQRGIFISGLAAALNWWLFYIVVPITTLVLGLSIGRFPKRRILRRRSYFRWSAIWGAILVLAPSLFGVAVTNEFDSTLDRLALSLISGGLTAILIGGVSGLAVGGIWLAIVRPNQQIKQVDTSVFT